MRVFSSEQLLHGHIPTPDSFTRCTQLVRDFAVAHPTVTAVLLGSTLETPSPTSDLDTVFLFDSRMGLIPFLPELDELAVAIDQEHVPFEFIALDPDLVKSGHSRINLGFREHIRWATEHHGVIHGDPVRLLRLLDRHVTGTLRDNAGLYTGIKFQKLSELLARFRSLTPFEQLEVLGELVSTPIHAARKALHAHHPEFSQGWSKQQIVEEWEAIDPRGLGHALRRIYEVGDTYTAYVRHCQTNPVRVDDHERLLERIWQLGVPVLEFLRHILTTEFCYHP